jgi:hypothetical protein
MKTAGPNGKSDVAPKSATLASAAPKSATLASAIASMKTTGPNGKSDLVTVWNSQPATLRHLDPADLQMVMAAIPKCIVGACSNAQTKYS